MKLIKVYLLIFAVWIVSVYSAEEPKDRYLSLPILAKCEKRFMESSHEGRNFFYSGHDPELKDTRLDWLDARNTCRERCMETVSFETQEKFDFFKNYIERNNVTFVWTSGRICDFDGCEGRWDLLPKRIKGWLWSANQIQLDDTNKLPSGWSYQPWSRTGVRKRPQPDNGEFYISQTPESCLGVLNNMYNDSVSWHDIACYHKARFICEDSEALYGEALELNENGSLDATEGTSPRTTTTPTTVATRRVSKTATTTKKIQITKTDFPSTTTNRIIVKTEPLDEEVTTEKKSIDIRGEKRYRAGSKNSTLLSEEEVFSDEDYLDSTDDVSDEEETAEEDETTTVTKATTTTTSTTTTKSRLHGRFKTRSRS